jgi:NAD(P)-dependent dehydrogenase (short-subunit alcohol dehydrogenase family)
MPSEKDGFAMTTTKRTALVTGASRGLGLALARGLAQNGWQLIVDARDADALEQARRELAEHTRVIAIAGDVTDAGHRSTLSVAADALGGLDAVVNNAGMLGPSPQPNLLDYPLDVLADVYRANVIAPLGVLQAVRHQLKAGARIVNVTSDAGVEPYAGWGGYGSSKAALEQLSSILAAEQPDLRVFWVDPGDMRTQMHQDAFPNEDISDRPLPDESVPGLVALLEGDYASGRYKARHINNSDAKNNADAIRETRVVLNVRDFPNMRQLFESGLGLHIEKQWDETGGKGVVFEAGRATIELLDEVDASNTDRVEAGHATGLPMRLGLQVSDVPVIAGILKKHGIAVMGEAKLTSWGHFNQRLQTPEGVQITLFQTQVLEAQQS